MILLRKFFSCIALLLCKNFKRNLSLGGGGWTFHKYWGWGGDIAISVAPGIAAHDDTGPLYFRLLWPI